MSNQLSPDAKAEFNEPVTGPDAQVGEDKDPMKSRGIAVLVQFPRRVILLTIAYLLAIPLLVALWRPEAALEDPRLTAEQRFAIMEQMGIDHPPIERFFVGLGNFFSGNFGISFSNFPRPVSDIVAERASYTATLLIWAIFVSVLLTLVATGVASLIHKLEEEIGTKGSILRGIGRLCIFPQGSAPLLLLSFLALWVMGLKLGLLPIGGIIDPMLWRQASFSLNDIYIMLLTTSIVSLLLLFFSLLFTQLINGSILRWCIQLLVTIGIMFGFVAYWGGLAGDIVAYTRDVLSHLVLPSFITALLPSMLTSQALSRELTLSREEADSSLVRMGIYFKWLAILLGQTGGWIGIITVVETLFAYPGLGHTLLVAAQVEDVSTVFGVMVTMAAIVLWGRLLGELFRWLARLIGTPHMVKGPWPALVRKKSRRTWAIFTLSLLVVPLLLFVIGAIIHPVLLNTIWQPAIYDPVIGYDVTQIRHPAPPSLGHPLGTDILGRDILSQLMFGASSTLITVIIVAVVVTLVGLPFGSLSGSLVERHTWWAESIADLVLFFFNVLMMVPVLPMLVLIATIWNMQMIPLAFVTAALLVPRSIFLYQTLWLSTPEEKKWQRRFLSGVGVLFLSGAFMALYVTPILNFFGLLNIRMSWGIMLLYTQASGYLLDFRRWWLIFPAMGTIWLCSVIFYTAADALTGYFVTKEALVRMNE
jgi:ABC-type dipeptide/oligopeptide/nickel transport system permease component/ABC-type dipeptide/oligopeptide/nickel transport system permease subunit